MTKPKSYAAFHFRDPAAHESDLLMAAGQYAYLAMLLLARLLGSRRVPSEPMADSASGTHHR
ncbi:hypothetical protein [Rhodococcus koreensis]